MKKLILIIGIGLSMAAHAQVMVNHFILPDGRAIPTNKLDSVKKAWNGDSVAFQHDEEDDKQHVMHLVRMTPEMSKEFEAAGRKQKQALQAMIGQPAPDFSIKDMTGKTRTLSELKGKVVVLNFWFTSCPPCNDEMPELNRIVKDYQGKDVVFLALTFNAPGNVQAFLKNHTFNYTILPSSNKVDKAYQISSWPTSIVIGRDGKIVYAMNAVKDIYSELSAQIDRAAVQ